MVAISCGQEPQGDCQLQTRLDGLSQTGVLPRDGGPNHVQDFQEYIWCQPSIVPEHSGFSGFSIAHACVQQIVVVAQVPPPCLSEPVLDPYGSPRTLPHPQPHPPSYAQDHSDGHGDDEDHGEHVVENSDPW